MSPFFVFFCFVFYRFSGRAPLLLVHRRLFNSGLFFFSFFFSSRIRSALGEKHFIVLAGAPAGVAPAIPSVLPNTVGGEQREDEGQMMLQHLRILLFIALELPSLFFACSFFFFAPTSFQTLLICWEPNFPLDLCLPQPSVRKAT